MSFLLSADNINYPHEIFMDANATTPVLPELQALMGRVYNTHYGNPSSPHYAGIRANRILIDARAEAGRLLTCAPERILFMSGATEGINTAVLSVLRGYTAGRGKGRYLLYGATEHKAVPEALRHWNDLLQVGAELKAIPVDSNGQLDREFIRAHVSQGIIICTMGANNETGVFADLTQLEQVIRNEAESIPWLVDCVQMLGKRPVDLGRTTIDYAPFSAHKLYGPKGVGAMYVREGAPFTPLQTGGGQEKGLRGGTENVAGVAALGQIFAWLNQPETGPFQDADALYGYRDEIIAALKAAFPNLIVNHPLMSSLPTTLNFSVAGYSSAELIAIFDAAGIRVSAGSACSTGGARSFVLDAMGLPAWQSEGAIRMSFGPAFKQSDCNALCERLTFIREKITGVNGWGQGALYIPEPLSSGTGWIICRTTQQVLALKEPERVIEDIHACCANSNWQVRKWNQSSQDFAGFQIEPHKQGVQVTARATKRSLVLTDSGVVMNRDVHPIALAVAELRCNDMALVDVREASETRAQYLQNYEACFTSIPRALWCDYLLTTVLTNTREPVFFCRSGRRAHDVARLALSLGWPRASVCSAAASEVFDWIQKQQDPVF